MKDQRGHTPILLDAAAKLERCTGCRDERRRGDRWARACPGGDRNITPLVVPVGPQTHAEIHRGEYHGRTKIGG